MLTALAIISLFVGALVVYLSAPKQGILPNPLPKSSATIAGVILLISSLAILLTLLGVATALFAWLTGLMLVWTVAPLGLVWIFNRRGRGP
ncbi:MAG: hypothetical protein ACK5NN_03720 [Sphingomonadaceae bacterium]